MLLEICASTYQSALNAQKASADRIELCEDLSVGGVTPSKSLIQKVVSELQIPVFVLIRPRGGDFVYSEKEFHKMKLDIEFCKSVGCKGIVSGVLKNDNTIDIKRTRELIELSQPLSFTFHRAFDKIGNQKKALQQLIKLQCDTILTSGNTDSAVHSIHLLKELNTLARKDIAIMPGGGIRSKNALLFKDIGFKTIHTSATERFEDSDLNEIKKLIDILKP